MEARCSEKKLQAQLQEINRDLRRQDKKLRYHQCREMLNPRRCQILKTALVIFSLTAPITLVAMEYIRFMHGKKKRAKEEPFALNDVLDYYNDFSIEERGRMVEAYDETWGIHLERAQRWLRDNELRNWVTEQNVEKAVAPSNKQLWLRKIGQPSQDAIGALRPNRSANMKQRQRNQWIRRWAKRHKVFQGAFKNGERLPLRTLQAKAPSFRKGAGPKIENQAEKWSRKRSRKTGAKTGLPVDP